MTVCHYSMSKKTPLFILRVIVLLTPAHTVNAYSVEAKQIEKTKLKTSISVYLWRQTTPFIKLTRKIYGGVYIYLKKKEYKNNLMYLEGYVMS